MVDLFMGEDLPADFLEDLPYSNAQFLYFMGYE